MIRMRKVWLILVFAAFAFPAAAQMPVDLELVIATDVSRSIDEGEARLQRQGIADAFKSQQVVRTILGGFLKKVAVAYIDYSSRDYNEVVIDWHIIDDQQSANAFAAKLLAAPLTFGRRTSISDGIEHAVEMLETNAIEGTRRIIDVSGDGPNNHGRLVSTVRDETIAKRITINGLPILNDEGELYSPFYIPDLDKYYRGCVIGGAGSFILVAKDFKDFARAIRKKLVLEIAGLTPDDIVVAPATGQPGRGVIAKASVSHTSLLHLTASPLRRRLPHTGFVYEKGCDIGERMRLEYFGSDSFDDP